MLTLSAPALFLAKCKSFFLENLLLARFLCWREISGDLFLSEDFELFFHIGVKKLGNQVINEIFRQITIPFTLPLDVSVRPMDTKWLNKDFNFFLSKGNLSESRGGPLNLTLKGREFSIRNKTTYTGKGGSSVCGTKPQNEGK